MAGKKVRRRLHPSDPEKDNEDHDSRENPEEEGCPDTPVTKQATNGAFRGGWKRVLDFHAAGKWLWNRQN
jgi:hypothetical protein